MSIFKQKLELAQMEVIEDPSKDYYFHAWVYIATSEESGFFIESTTGERHPLSHSTYKRFQPSVFPIPKIIPILSTINRKLF